MTASERVYEDFLKKGDLMFSLENLTNFLLENPALVIWAFSILLISILIVLLPFFLWRISANTAAIRELIEAYLREISKRSENTEYHFKA
jgi:hypothetical protein